MQALDTVPSLTAECSVVPGAQGSLPRAVLRCVCARARVRSCVHARVCEHVCLTTGFGSKTWYFGKRQGKLL